MKKFLGGCAVSFVLLLALMFLLPRVAPSWQSFTSKAESSDSQVIKAVEREEQVVLVSLGIQGISEKTEKSKFLGVNVPGSERASFLQYSFKAKLGLEGKEVRITPIGENSYRVWIPEFQFIGHDNLSFKLVAEDNGVMSWVTPKNDPVEMINKILSEDAKSEYVASNRDLLREQAESFYGSIIMSINPQAHITYDYGA